jgi:methionyl-tRNA synthetase
MSDNKFYLTTPIYYVNARPHIGHAYTTIVADVLARRHRLLGDDTYFLTGTDEHGQKIERSAAAAGIPPQQFADQVSKSFEDLWHRMGITNNDYIRTTDDRHKRGVQKLFSKLYERGFIKRRNYTGSYCVSDEAFVDAAVGSPCPDCGRLLEEVTEENFFFELSEFQEPLLDLIESDTIAITPNARKNEVLSFLRGNVNAFVDMTVDPIQEKISDVHFGEIFSAEEGRHPTRAEAERAAVDQGEIKPSARGNRFVTGALKDLSISRTSFSWGIPVPEPAASAAVQKHVIYVWLDALANYMTALGYGSDDETLFQNFWPADLHLVGKEIIRFHCVYWPAFLLALNPKLQHKSDEKPPQLTLEEHIEWAEKWLPKQITAHGWLLFDNSKMSKSKGNIVRTETILEAFGTLCPPPLRLSSFAEGGRSASPATPQPFPESTDRKGTASAVPQNNPQDAALAAEVRPPTSAERDLFASDVLRYYLLREIPFGQDGSFSFDSMITRYNADLANGYGNLVSRTLNMIQQYFAGGVPTSQWLPRESFAIGSNLLAEPALFCDAMRLTKDLGTLASYVTALDGRLSEVAPWKLAKSASTNSHKDLEAILYQAAESIRIITALLYPILPYATARVWAQLGLGDIELAARNGELKNLEWGGLKPGTKLGPLGPIFPRADKGLAQIMTDMENQDTAAPTTDNREPITASTDPAAPPRTSSLPESGGPLTVGGSHAHTTGPANLPSHTAVAASGIFANQPIPPTTDNPQPTTPQITIDDFAKVELRVAQILVAERIPKADKLLRLEVDLGPHGKRQILSGIAEWYTPEDLIGRRIVVITNLAPRKMRGLESHGMLLAASEGENGKPVLATFGENIALGSRLK